MSPCWLKLQRKSTMRSTVTHKTDFWNINLYSWYYNHNTNISKYSWFDYWALQPNATTQSHLRVSLSLLKFSYPSTSTSVTMVYLHFCGHFQRNLLYLSLHLKCWCRLLKKYIYSEINMWKHCGLPYCRKECLWCLSKFSLPALPDRISLKLFTPEMQVCQKEKYKTASVKGTEKTALKTKVGLI